MVQDQPCITRQDEGGIEQVCDLTPELEFHSSRGVVEQATWRGNRVVVKMLKHEWNEDRIQEIVARPRHYKAFFRSLRALQSISRHKNILPLEGYYFNAVTVQIGLVHPLTPTNLYEWSTTHRGKDGIDSKRYLLLREAAQGVHHLHTLKPPVIHGNIRASNIMLDVSGSAMIADFGIANLDDCLTSIEDGLGHRSQSIRWLAPELIRNYNMASTRFSDLFSFAQVVVEVFTGREPFHDASNEDLMPYIITGGRPTHPRGLNDRLWNLMKHQYWADSPRARGSIDDIMNILVTLAPLGV